jgi:hypothetical protein
MWGFLQPVAAREKLDYAGAAEGECDLLDEVKVSGRPCHSLDGLRVVGICAVVWSEHLVTPFLSSQKLHTNFSSSPSNLPCLRPSSALHSVFADMADAGPSNPADDETKECSKCNRPQNPDQFRDKNGSVTKQCLNCRLKGRQNRASVCISCP